MPWGKLVSGNLVPCCCGIEIRLYFEIDSGLAWFGTVRGMDERVSFYYWFLVARAFYSSFLSCIWSGRDVIGELVLMHVWISVEKQLP